MDFSTELHIKDHLAKITGSQITLTAKVDPAVIGGFVARVGDKVIDGSVRSKLRGLRQQIVELG